MYHHRLSLVLHIHQFNSRVLVVRFSFLKKPNRSRKQPPCEQIHRRLTHSFKAINAAVRHNQLPIVHMSLQNPSMRGYHKRNHEDLLSVSVICNFQHLSQGLWETYRHHPFRVYFILLQTGAHRLKYAQQLKSHHRVLRTSFLAPMLSDHDDIRVPIIYTFEKAIHRVQILSELVINVGCPGVQFVGCAGAFINRLEPWDCLNVILD